MFFGGMSVSLYLAPWVGSNFFNCECLFFIQVMIYEFMIFVIV